MQMAVVRLAAREHLAHADATAEPDGNDLQLMVDGFVAGFCVDAMDPGGDEWKPVHLTLDDIENIDQRDRIALEMLVLRIKSADEITAAVERGDDLEEAPGELDRLAAFRDHGGRATDRDDGEDVGSPAVIAAGAGG